MDNWALPYETAMNLAQFNFEVKPIQTMTPLSKNRVTTDFYTPSSPTSTTPRERRASQYPG